MMLYINHDRLFLPPRARHLNMGFTPISDVALMLSWAMVLHRSSTPLASALI